MINEIMKRLSELPNVTMDDGQEYIQLYDAMETVKRALEQEPKTGHWVGIDEEPHEDYECDKCGYVVSTYTANIEPHTEYKFCPNCGRRMVEEQESEVRNG